MKPTTMIERQTDPCQEQGFPPATAPSYVEALVDLGNVFRSPAEVAEHPWFTPEEKRTVLLSWARDELVLEQVASRTLPELRPRSQIEALSHLDPHAAMEYRAAVATIRASRSPSTRWRLAGFRATRA